MSSASLRATRSFINEDGTLSQVTRSWKPPDGSFQATATPGEIVGILFFVSSSLPTLGFNLRGKFLTVAGGLEGNLSVDTTSPTQERGLAWGRNFSDLSPASGATSGKTEDAQIEICSIWRHRHLHHSYRTDAGREIKRITVLLLKSLSDNFSSIYLDVSGNTPRLHPHIF